MYAFPPHNHNPFFYNQGLQQNGMLGGGYFPPPMQGGAAMWPGAHDSYYRMGSFGGTGSPLPPSMKGGFGSPIPPSHPGMPWAARQTTSSPPPSGPAADESSYLSQSCVRQYVTQKAPRQFDTFRDLTPTDEYYFDHPHAPQRICLRFSKLLDPAILCQALDKTSDVHPVALSRVAMFKGKRAFHVGCEDAKLSVVLVTPETLSSPREMSLICDKMQQGVPPEVPLFQAFLFRAKDASKGCALISCFHHVLGDATCYSVFISKWSELYSQLLSQKGLPRTPASEMPPSVYQRKEIRIPSVPTMASSLTARRYHFSTKSLAALKKEFGNSDQVTTNDVLLAQCMCAVGPMRRHALGGHASAAAYVALLADHRGRGLDEDSWGNATVDLSIFIPWIMLETGDVTAVAKEIRRQIKSEFDLLGSDLTAFNQRRMESGKKPRLFCWNSWVRAGRTIVKSNFGDASALADFEWLNLLHHVDIDTVLAVPVLSPTGTIAVQISCNNPEEFTRLDAMWGKISTMKKIMMAAEC